jgi:NAD(P)-dependent dehydrogenase (short-subunit alcohol dehydrogenase family)
LTSAKDDRRVALITGASRGIGLGVTQGFLAAGYNVVANARTIHSATCPGAIAVAGDIADPVTAERMVQEAVNRFGRVDVVVNNAGVFLSKRFTDYTTADFLAITNVGLAGFFHLSRQAAQRMLEQRRGHIVTITASIADQPLAEVPCALAVMVKGGLNAATRSLAIEYAEHGIRVNAVAPGVIDTNKHPAQAHDMRAQLQPMRRLGTVAEVVDAVLFLERASFVTGEVLHVDGGAHAGQW